MLMVQRRAWKGQIMRSLVMKFATPLIVGLFLVSLISGIALFAHVGGNLFRGMHIWLSMVLILPFVLHVWKNWRAMTVYFRQWAFGLSMVASLAAALVFVANANQGGWRQQAPWPEDPASSLRDRRAHRHGPEAPRRPSKCGSVLVETGLT
jgi:hypothetical protein